jgi:hypothetical protein
MLIATIEGELHTLERVVSICSEPRVLTMRMCWVAVISFAFQPGLETLACK